MNQITKETINKIVLKKKKHVRSESPKVSVIVPIFKVDRYLTKCLSSIIDQTMEELEIILIDEGDHDRCREIIDFFEAHDPRVIAPHRKNGGYGASCNLGIQMAKGEYISIIESDDFIEPEMYEEIYSYAKLLDADVVKTPYYEYFGEGTKIDCSCRQLLEECLPQNACFSMKEFGELLQIHASLWSCLYKNSYMKMNNIRFIEAKGAAYVDVGFRIDTLINTDKVAWINKPYYNYRIDSVGSSTNNFNMSAMLQRWKETHEKLCSIQEDYDKYYGPRLILDEYLNSVGWLWLRAASTAEYQQIAYNLSFVKPETIINTKYLTGRQKKELIDFKKNPVRFRRRVKTHRAIKKVQQLVERILNVLSEPILVQWLFIGFLTSLLTAAFVKLDILEQSKHLYYLEISNLFMMIFLMGIICCFIGKSMRKLYFMILKIFYNQRTKSDKLYSL